jgi:hypothetical protein
MEIRTSVREMRTTRAGERLPLPVQIQNQLLKKKYLGLFYGCVQVVLNFNSKVGRSLTGTHSEGLAISFRKN